MGGKGSRGEILGGLGPEEGALAWGVLDEFDGHFLGRAGSEPSMYDADLGSALRSRGIFARFAFLPLGSAFHSARSFFFHPPR